MSIACLGWGSLVWKPDDLPLRNGWFQDGPLLPVEFARQSSDDRITLVVVPGKPYVRTLWVLLSVLDLDTARRALAKREHIQEENIAAHIGSWSREGGSEGALDQNIGRWAIQQQLESVVWTALPPKFARQEGRIPTADEVIAYLRGPGDRSKAEEYIRRTPLQIDTDSRRRIISELGWNPTS